MGNGESYPAIVEVSTLWDTFLLVLGAELKAAGATEQDLILLALKPKEVKLLADKRAMVVLNEDALQEYGSASQHDAINLGSHTE